MGGGVGFGLDGTTEGWWSGEGNFSPFTVRPTENVPYNPSQSWDTPAPGSVDKIGPNRQAAIQAEKDRTAPMPTNNGGGYNAAAAVAAMLKSIEESYNRQVQGLDKNKATANTGIQNAYSQFRTNTDANNNVYQQGANQISADVSNRAAQSMQQAQQANQQIQQSVGGLGGDIGALRAQAQGNELALQGSNNAQQDLTARIAQIVAANHSSTQGSGDLVRQGAVGNLENNYTGMLNALMSSKEQQIAQANQSAYSGGGGGGGGSSADVNYKDAMEQAIYQQMLGSYQNGEVPDQSTILNNLAFTDPAAYLTAIISMNNGQQSPQ